MNSKEDLGRKKGRRLSADDLFNMEGKPSFLQAFPLSLQHVAAMIVGCVTPAIIVANAAGLSDSDSVILIQAALFVSALTTRSEEHTSVGCVTPAIIVANAAMTMEMPVKMRAYPPC